MSLHARVSYTLISDFFPVFYTGSYVHGTVLFLCSRKFHTPFKKVYKAKWHGPVAVKKLKCQDPTKDQIEGFRQEVKMLRKCRHENIVLFMSYILDPPKHMCIVMHWCASSLYK